MVRWLLNHLPSPVLAGLIVAAAVGVGALAELWHWRSHQRRPQPVRSNEMLTVAVEFVGVAYAILIGFVIVNLWQDQSNAADIVSEEVSSLQDIVTLSQALPPGDTARISTAVRAYCDVVVNDEWRRLRNGHRSPHAREAANGVLKAIAEIDGSSPLADKLQSSMIDSFKDLRGFRTRRIALANVPLARELWFLVILSSVAMILLVGAFEGEGRWQVGTTLIIAATIGTILFVIVALSYPFSGQVAVSSKPFVDLVANLPR